MTKYLLILALAVAPLTGFGQSYDDFQKDFRKALDTDFSSADDLDSLINFYKLDVNRFFQDSGFNYLLFERWPTFSKRDAPKARIKISNDGIAEYYDYFESEPEPVRLTRQLDTSVVREIFNSLVATNYVRLVDPRVDPRVTRHENWSDIKHSGQHHLPIYRITTHIDGIDYSLRVYGLGGLGMHNSLVDVRSISIGIGDKSNTDSEFAEILDSLAAIWSEATSLDWVKQKIDSMYGNIEPIDWSRGVYRFTQTPKRQLIRIGFPDLTPVWKVSLDSLQNGKQESTMWCVLFEIDNLIYAIDGESGKLLYNLQWDSVDFPFFRVLRGNIYLGARRQDGLEVKEYSHKTGEYLRTVKSVVADTSWIYHIWKEEWQKPQE